MIELEAPLDLCEEGQGVTTGKISCVNVLSLFQYLIDDHGLWLSRETLQQYWTHVRTYFPWGSTHPACTSTHQDYYYPISVCGDEARYTDSQGVLEKV